jgi:hypothetical protein
MTNKVVQVSLDGLVRLQSAAMDFARPEIIRIAEVVIADLQSRPIVGFFDDVAARHMWDEYCWALQEGPFNWDDDVRAFVTSEVEKLPPYALIFLSAYVFEEDANSGGMTDLGGIWVDGIVDTVMTAINQRASRRNLDLIAPHRADVIGYEIQGSGMVWSALTDRGEAMDFIAGHADAMIDPDADLSDLAGELVEAFVAGVNEDNEGYALAEFLDRFGKEARALLLEQDVLPALDGMRSALIGRLDG